MLNSRIKYIYFSLICLFFFIGCSLLNSKVHISDIKTTTGINKDFSPTEITSIFPYRSTKIYCWFKWQDSEVGTPITARWTYETDKIEVLNHTFKIPRRNGMGSIALSLPKSNPLPSGTYQVSLLHEKQILRRTSFQIK